MRPIEEPARNRAGVGHARAVGTAVKSCDAVELSEGRRASAKARLSPARARVDADRRRADPGRGHPASTIDHAGSADGPVPRLHPPEPDRTSREQVDLRGPLGPGSMGPIDLGAEAEAARTGGGIPAEHAIRGFHGVTLMLGEAAPTAAILTDVLGFVAAGREGGIHRFRAEGAKAGGIVDIHEVGGFLAGRSGRGSVHHVAFRAADDVARDATRYQGQLDRCERRLNRGRFWLL